MSKLARKPINISDVEASVESSNLTIKGKHGELSLNIPHDVNLNIDDNGLTVTARKKNNWVYFVH